MKRSVSVIRPGCLINSHHHQLLSENVRLFWLSTRCFAADSFRHFSNDSSKDARTNSNKLSAHHADRSGPIRIKSTPRSVAAAKLRTTAPDVEVVADNPVLGIGEISDSRKAYAELLLPHAGVGENKFQLASYGEESLYTLVLLRHGESEWNRENRFTGWCDVSLTKKGEMEARTAGRLLYENGIEIDHAFSSVLKRASFSCNMALNMAQVSRDAWKSSILLL